MMAAISAAEALRIIKGGLLEKNESLKALVTGKGRCNLTNACDRDVFENIITNPGFYIEHIIIKCL